VVADVRLGTRVGATLRIVGPAGDARYRVSGLADARGAGDNSQAAVFFTPAVAATLAGAPGQVNAVGVIAEPGTSAAMLSSRLKERLGRGFDVLDRRHAADADAGDPTAADRAARCSSPVARLPSGRSRATPPPIRASSRSSETSTWRRSTRPTSTGRGVWLIVGLATALATLALINTAAMTTTERRDELATIRLLGGTPGHAIRMVTLEMLPTVITALAAGAAIVAVAVAGVPRGITGVPLDVPLPLIGALMAGATVLGVLAAAVTTRLALRASPVEAMRGKE
jgi:putative ABC transport system permease protein